MAMPAGAAPLTYPAAKLITPQQVIFGIRGWVGIARAAFPAKELKPGEQRPAVIFMHGGSRREMLLGWHYMGYYHNAYAFNQYLASRGYVVLSLNYRSGIGYGLDFREALNYGPSGASEFKTSRAPASICARRADVDPASASDYGAALTEVI